MLDREAVKGIASKSILSHDDYLTILQLQKKTFDMFRGNGICECGECVCNGGNFGSHCQCQSTGCAVSNNQLCGGSDNF